MAFVKRSMSLHGHRTSLALEPEFWDVVDAHVKAEGLSLAGFISGIDDTRNPESPLSSAVRVWALGKAAEAATD